MIRDGHYYERVGQKYKTKRDRMGQSGRGRNLGGYKGAAGGQGWCGLESGSMEDDSWCSGPGELWQRSRPDAMALALCQASPRRRATRSAPLGAGRGGVGGGLWVVGGETGLRGEGQGQGQDRTGQDRDCSVSLLWTVRMKSVLDSETRGWMDGWGMDGWDGKRTGRKGKKD